MTGAQREELCFTRECTYLSIKTRTKQSWWMLLAHIRKQRQRQRKNVKPIKVSREDEKFGVNAASF